MKEKPIVCPKCKGRLFFEGRNGEKTCTKCGFVIYGEAPATDIPETKAKTPTKSSPCPICGSLADLLDTDPNGREIYSCSFCGNRFTPMPKMPKPQQPAAPQESASQPAKQTTKATPKDKPLNGKQIFEHALKNTVEVISVNYGNGSGFFFADGFVMTNAHVVIDERTNNPVSSIKVNFKGGQEASATIIGYDIKEDMAILSTQMKCEEPVRFAKKELETGEAIYAVGNTAGEGMCILEGIVADKRRKVNGSEFTMISANIFHGNSGGPVFNTKGEFVGIASGGVEKIVAMNFSIPVDRVLRFIRAVEQQTRIRFELVK